jgi:hypothetical protein
MAQRKQTSPAHIVTQALRSLEPGAAGVRAFPFLMDDYEKAFGLDGEEAAAGLKEA